MSTNLFLVIQVVVKQQPLIISASALFLDCRKNKSNEASFTLVCSCIWKAAMSKQTIIFFFYIYRYLNWLFLGLLMLSSNIQIPLRSYRTIILAAVPRLAKVRLPSQIGPRPCGTTKAQVRSTQLHLLILMVKIGAYNYFQATVQLKPWYTSKTLEQQYSKVCLRQKWKRILSTWALGNRTCTS